MTIDEYYKQVYALGGGVVSSPEGVAVVSIPGMVTKFEPLDRAIERLNAHLNKQDEQRDLR